MYVRQKGLLPTLTFFSGFFLIAYFALAAFGNIYLYWSEASSSLPLIRVVTRSLAFAVPLLIAILPVVLFGLFLAGMFPEIRIVKDGIKYRYLQFVSGSILWDEIEEVISLKRPANCLALAISRKGYSFLNHKGLWINALHGRLVKCEYPVLLLSAGLESRDQILEEIRKRRPHLFGNGR